jgi:hypothetical protein
MIWRRVRFSGAVAGGFPVRRNLPADLCSQGEMDHLRRIIGRVDKPWLIPLADRLLRELAGTVEFSGCPSETAAAAGLIGQCRPGFEGIALRKAAGSTCARLLATIQAGGFFRPPDRYRRNCAEFCRSPCI